MGNTVFFLFSLHAKIETLLQGFHVYDISGIWQVLRGIIQIVEKEPDIGLKKNSKSKWHRTRCPSVSQEGEFVTVLNIKSGTCG